MDGGRGGHSLLTLPPTPAWGKLLAEWDSPWGARAREEDVQAKEDEIIGGAFFYSHMIIYRPNVIRRALFPLFPS